MRFLADQDVYGLTIRFLRDLGHDVVTARELQLSRAQDEVLLRTAQTDRRIFVTRDKDFGNLVFVAKMGAGVIFVRVLPSTLDPMHRELQTVLGQYTEEELLKAFVVVE